jgi:streptogramin lyase
MSIQPGFLEKTSRHGGRFAAGILAVAAMGFAGSARGQSFTEFALPFFEEPGGIAAGPDGNIWFTEHAFTFGGPKGPNIGKIGRITPAGVITEFAIPSTDSQPGDIAAGPDGALWFTDESQFPEQGKIGRITTAGVINEFPLPIARTSLFGIAAGSDGNMWFTESVFVAGGSSIGKIGRITTTGVVTEFALDFEATPGGIAAGPDGNLWFTFSAGNGSAGIGRITTAGDFSTYAVACGGSPSGIVAGPDGNLWLTKSVFAMDGPSVGKIGRINPGVFTGSPPPFPVTEFTVPEASLITDSTIPFGSAPLGIASGPDDNLWFTDRAIGKIGRITTAGAITELTPPTPFSLPFAIAAGPNGDLWFTEVNANKIGRITALGQACTPSATSLCLNNARFKVEATWTTSDGASGPAQAVALTPDGGYFWFFSRVNAEMMVKAPNGCSFNNHYWVFAAGLTNVNVVLKVTDSRTGQVNTYTNPQGAAFQPVQDTSAFACP